jgi:hypothetical protein
VLDGALRERERVGCQVEHTRRYEDMVIYRELDNRKMRDRDASMGSGDRGNGGDADSLTGDTGGSANDMGTSKGSGQNWDEPGVDTGGGMDRSTDTASGGNWGDSSGLSDDAAGPGAGDWASGDNDTGYTDPGKNRGG